MLWSMVFLTTLHSMTSTNHARQIIYLLKYNASEYNWAEFIPAR
jgi:hypothetical protein